MVTSIKGHVVQRVRLDWKLSFWALNKFEFAAKPNLCYQG